MPAHDWSRVAAGIFHDFHHAWIEEIKRSLNAGLLPSDYYALAEQRTAGYGPDVLALQIDAGEEGFHEPSHRNGGLLVAKPQVAVTVETDMEFQCRNVGSSSITAPIFRRATSSLGVN